MHARGNLDRAVPFIILSSLAVLGCSPSTIMSSPQYPAPPPSYQPGPAPKAYRDNDAAEPLLGSPRSPAGPSNGIYNQPDDDIPDDFKYGTTVQDSSTEVRAAFVRKVYSILCKSIVAFVCGFAVEC